MTVTSTTGGRPEGTRSGSGRGTRGFEKNQSVASTRNRTMPIVLMRLLRRPGSRVDRGRKGGGLELLREGYAKCILSVEARSDEMKRQDRERLGSVAAEYIDPGQFRVVVLFEFSRSCKSELRCDYIRDGYCGMAGGLEQVCRSPEPLSIVRLRPAVRQPR